MKHSTSRFACAVLCSLTAACADKPPEQNESGSTGRLAAALSAGSPYDVATVRFRIVSAAQTCTDTPLFERTIPLRTEHGSNGGESPNPSDTHPSSDVLFVLEPGDYRICAQPLKADSTPSVECGLAQATAKVFPRVTTEVTLVSQCQGDAKGGLGITTILNGPPHIDDLIIEPSFLTSCDEAKLTVTASDPNGDAISYAWELTLGNTAFSPSDNTVTFGPASAGDYEVRATVKDSHEAISSLAIPLHVSTGACDSGATCAPPAPGFPGVYRGVATVSDYTTEPLDVEEVPYCSERSSRKTVEVVLDVSGPPYAVSLTPLPGLALDLTTSTFGEPVWELSPDGLSLTHEYPCVGNIYWDGYAPATISFDPSTGTATFRAHCETGHIDPCGFPTNEQTDWEMVLPLSCVKNQTVYVADSAVTCDADGTISSSVPCNAPPGPCAPPMPDACGSGMNQFCTALQTDRKNCGQCGRACLGEQECHEGACVSVCVDGTIACPHPYTVGTTTCEDVTSSIFNCGACDHFCLPTTECIDGQCVGCQDDAPDRCSRGYGTPSFCTNLLIDQFDCGSCFNACARGETCESGRCLPW